MFVKSGSENYILGKVNFNVPEADALTVVASEKTTERTKYPTNFISGPWGWKVFLA